MSNNSSSQMVTTIAGVAIGTVLAASAAILYMKFNYFDVANTEIGAVINPTPVQAVMDKLPQVAVIGQKPGPAGTMEVFIQVPGILNMQSVYVMSDNETVISGFVVPETQRGSGVPGGQLELPSGQPTVDPRAPNANRNKILSMTGQKPNEQASASPLPVRPVSVPVPTPRSEPTNRIASDRNNDRSQQTNKTDIPVPQPRQSVPGSELSVPHMDSPQPLPPAAIASQPSEAWQSSGDYLKVASISGRANFKVALSTALSEKAKLVGVQKMTSDSDQQGAYLDLVRNLPSIKQGSGPKHLYVLFDPNCPVCHRYYNEVKASANAGRVTVNWIPVTIFPERRSSITASAELLETRDSLGQVAALGMLHSMMTQQGFIEQVDQAFNDNAASASYLDQVVTNTGALVMARAETPLIVFEGTEGELLVEAGIPDGGYLNLIKVGGY